ncbi:MAG TPA: hypothetical protein VFV87_13540, partial [Pirellulaceae bacterium]|nr:hypothetical protein [Pirellulaceae bacterium]
MYGGPSLAWVAGIVAVNCAAAALAQSPGETGREEQKIARLIKQLDADRFEDRERASRELREIGQPALAALRRAAEHPSLEVRTRAKAITSSIVDGPRLREFIAFASQPNERLDLEH